MFEFACTFFERVKQFGLRGLIMIWFFDYLCHLTSTSFRRDQIFLPLFCFFSVDLQPLNTAFPDD